MTTLYRKKGRRYVVHCNEQRWDFDADRMKPGTWRMEYCYADGSRRYRYDVRPDTASFLAACELAGQAMQERIVELAAAHPSPPSRPYTKRQLEILQHFRDEMAAAGGSFPTWWNYLSARELSDAAIDAVRTWGKT